MYFVCLSVVFAVPLSSKENMPQKAQCIKLLFTVLLYLLLLFLFCYFYFISQMTDFFKGRTTITSRIEKPNTLEPPTMTICFDPPFKTSVARQFGLVEHFDYRVLELPSGISYGQRFQKLSYLLDEDYKVKMSKMSLDKQGKNTSKIGEGSNTVNGEVFAVFSTSCSPRAKRWPEHILVVLVFKYGFHNTIFQKLSE